MSDWHRLSTSRETQEKSNPARAVTHHRGKVGCLQAPQSSFGLPKDPWLSVPNLRWFSFHRLYLQHKMSFCNFCLCARSQHNGVDGFLLSAPQSISRQAWLMNLNRATRNVLCSEPLDLRSSLPNHDSDVDPSTRACVAGFLPASDRPGVIARHLESKC